MKTVTMACAMPGFMLLNEALQPIAFNSEAVHILAFPTRPDRIQQTTVFLNDRVKSSLVDRRKDSDLTFVKVYRSGRRQYICRAFLIDGSGPADPLWRTAVLLERQSSSVTELSNILGQYDLTPRELEVVALLVEGLTSKEIANRMKISPNTVKAFLRLVMVKMDVSTRSGIVGKIIGPNSREHG